jgi:hypothetical protein
MWRISYKEMTLEQVLIMAYMNVVERRSDQLDALGAFIAAVLE